jgi:hypothetical protein
MAKRSRKREFEQTTTALWQHFAQSPTMQNALLVEINRAGQMEMEKRAQLSAERNPRKREKLKRQADHFREVKQELQGIALALNADPNVEATNTDLKG